MTEQWMMQVEGGLRAHFKVPDGTSRPGVHWTIVLKHGDNAYKVWVKVLFADDATPEEQTNQEYLVQLAMQYSNDQLGSGWHPSQEMEHTIYIGDPHQADSTPSKPWWKLW